MVSLRGRKRYYWQCVCCCGEVVKTEHYSLLGGKSRSCGCLQREKVAAHRRGRGHGESLHAGNTAEYRIWCGMIQRCCNPSDRAFKDYGGRGIGVSQEWRNSYECFLANVGRRPSPLHSLDRKNNDGNYEAGNVRWATKTEQSRNCRGNRRLTHDGKTLCIAEWAEVTGLPATVLYLRVYKGWPDSKVLTTPVRILKRRARG